MEEKYYISEEEMKKALFPDDFIAWLINEIDKCDDIIEEHKKHVDPTYYQVPDIPYHSAVNRRAVLKEVRKQYQELILDKKRDK